MSKTLPKPNRKNQVGEYSEHNGAAVNVGPVPMHNMPNGANSVTNPVFQTPHINMPGRMPADYYAGGQNQVSATNPSMSVPAGTQVYRSPAPTYDQQMGMAAGGSIPRQYIPQQYIQQTSSAGYYQPQYAPVQYAAGPQFYPMQYPQQYAQQGQMGQPIQQNQMSMTQQPAPAAQPPAAQPRARKVLAIIDPTTKQAVDLGTTNAPNGASSEAEPATSKKTPEDVEKKTLVRQDFAKQVLEQLGPSSREHRVSESSQSVKSEVAAPAVKSIPVFIPAESRKEASPAAEVVEPVVVSAPVFVPKSKAVENIVEEEKETVPSNHSNSVSSAEAAPSSSVNADGRAEVIEDEKEIKEEETVKEVIKETSQPKESKESTPVASEPVVEESKESSIERVSEVVPSTTAPTSSAIDEVVHEEAEETEAEPEKTPEEKAEEEAEKRRQLEIELDTLLNSLMADKDECDPEKMTYTRKFLHCVRDVEREFKRTPCTKTEVELKNFGIDRASMPQGREGKKVDFNPSWARNKNPAGDRPRTSYGGRFSVDSSHRGGSGGSGGRGHPRKPAGARPSIERTIDRAVPLHKADKAWKADKKLDNLPEDEAAKKLVLKNVRSLMNKITPTSQGELTKEFLDYKVSQSADILAAVIDIIFDKAVEEPKFCPLYSEICKSQVNVEVQQVQNKSPFRDAILSRAQATFVRRTGEDEERSEKLKAIEEEADTKKKQMMQMEMAEQDAKFRRRKFGNITFIGQLFRQQLLSVKVVQWCVIDLLRGTDDATMLPVESEEAIACAVQLLESIGKLLDDSVAAERKKSVTGAAAPVNVDGIFKHLDSIKDKVCNRIRFMIINLMELRRNGYKLRKVAETGPKKLDQIHNDIKQEQIENQQAREKYERAQGMRGGPSMGGGGGSMRKQQYTGRNSLDQRMNQSSRGPVTDKDRKVKAAAAANLTSSTVPAKNMSISKADDGRSLGKQSNWKGGSRGGGGPDAGNQPQPARANAWGARGSTGSRDGSEARKLSAADERAQAVAAAREIGSGKGPTRSESQTSVASHVSQTEETEEAKELREEFEKKLLNTINSDVTEYISGDLPLEEASSGLYSFANNEKKGNLPLRTVFKCLARSAISKMKKNMLAPAGHILAHALQLKEEKEKREEALKGFADFCEYAVEEGIWEDHPNMWDSLAEVIVNAIQCDMPVFEGARPTIDDFGAAYKISARDDRKPFTLLTTVLKRNAEIIHEREPADSETIISMMFEEMKCVADLEKEKLEEALKKIECPEGLKDKHENLHALLTGHH